jgi:hypothetical protein
MSLEQLEKDVAELKAQVAALLARLPPAPAPLNAPKDDWLSAVLGRFKGDTEFGEAVKAGREFRKTGRLPEPPASEVEE